MKVEIVVKYFNDRFIGHKQPRFIKKNENIKTRQYQNSGHETNKMSQKKKVQEETLENSVKNNKKGDHKKLDGKCLEG